MVDSKHTQMEEVTDKAFDLVPLLSSPVQNQLSTDDSGKVRPKGPRTFGWRVHNEITYRGVDWIANSTIGVTTAWITEKTKWGKEHLGDNVVSFFDKILKPVVKDGEVRKSAAIWGNRFTSIIVGGTLIILPMMALENKRNKKRMVRAIDETRYGKDIVDSNPKFQECYDNIDKEPDKKFTTGMGSRFLVLAPLLAITLNKKSNAWMEQHVYEHIGKATAWLAESIGIEGKVLKERFEMVHPRGDTNLPKVKETQWQWLHKIIGFDIGLTFAYCFMHEAAYKTLAALGLKDKKTAPTPKDEKPAAAPAQLEVPASEPTGSRFTEMVGKPVSPTMEAPKERHTEKLANTTKASEHAYVGA